MRCMAGYIVVESRTIPYEDLDTYEDLDSYHVFALGDGCLACDGGLRLALSVARKENHLPFLSASA